MSGTYGSGGGGGGENSRSDNDDFIALDCVVCCGAGWRSWGKAWEGVEVRWVDTGVSPFTGLFDKDWHYIIRDIYILLLLVQSLLQLLRILGSDRRGTSLIFEFI